MIKAMTEQEKAELIEHAKYLKTVCSPETEDYAIAEIALASLTARPVADVVSWSHPEEERTCSVQLRDFHLHPGVLYAAPPVPVMKAVALPSSFRPATASHGFNQIAVMRLDKDGKWLNKTGVINALREAGIQIEGEE